MKGKQSIGKMVETYGIPVAIGVVVFGIWLFGGFDKFKQAVMDKVNAPKA